MPASRHGIFLSAGDHAATQPGSGEAKESFSGFYANPERSTSRVIFWYPCRARKGVGGSGKNQAA